MRVARLISSVWVIALWLGCSGIRVTSDWDPEVDFASVKTWSWAPVPQKAVGDPHYDDDTLFTQRVRRAVERELATKGLRFEPPDGSDVQVAFYIVVEDKINVSTINDYYGYGPGWGYGPGGHGTQTVVSQYKQGTLVIDIARSGGHQLVWRGSGTARLRQESSPKRSEKRVNEAVQRILARFPPASSKGG